jgi:toxin ParE1/3/4
LSPYRLHFHEVTSRDLAEIAGWIAEFAGAAVAGRKLRQIMETISRLAETPHRGSLRHPIVPNLRGNPAAGKAVTSFVVDDATAEVLILSVTWNGAEKPAIGNNGV